MKVKISKPATNDLAEAFAYINARSPRAAKSLRSAIRTVIRSLSLMPNRGRVASALGHREILVTGTPYVIVYTVDAKHVTVLRIRHIRQGPRI